MADLLAGIEAVQVATNRVRTHVLARSGQAAGDPVVLVHGNISSGLFFQELLLALPQEYRGLAPDLRGYGETEPAPIDATRSLGDFADDLAALLAALGIPTAHFAGWSMGGGVILQLLSSHPHLVRSLTLIDPVSPFGFGGTKGLDGEPCAPDGAGSGGGAANPEYVRRLREGDRSADDPNSPRNVMNAFYFKPPFRSPLEETFMDSMLMSRVGDDYYPGDMRPSEHWPNVAPGDRGVLNTMAAGRLRLDGIVNVAPKPPILWVRGDSDLIVSDQSMLDFGTLGSLGYVPGWPGAQVAPPQPMVSQMRAVLERYQSAGGTYAEVVIEDAGHAPFIEQPARFHEAFLAHLARVR
jgi:pimeloyl-ACP methyl ester carboxylesterase